ncbi:MAG: glycoside hydrolase family 95 protein [Haliscomenobacter sp.]|nr:glycoside hydrolase family 95 protein [Haliscomenobacter sp.]
MPVFMKNLLILFLSLSLVCSWAQTPDRLMYYAQPAKHFEESLVLGNGRIGAVVHGGIKSDKIFLNDATLWAGSPVDPDMNPTAYTHLPAIREALRQEDYRKADSLNRRHLQGKFSESYAPLGTLYIDMAHAEAASNYRRQLDLSTAISTTSYQLAGVTYTREYFISHPQQVLLIRMTASQLGKLSFNLRFNSLLRHQVNTSTNVLNASGRAPAHAEPSYRRVPDPIQYDDQKSMRFLSLVKIIKTDGKIVRTDSTIGVQGGKEAIIMVSIATSFNGFDQNPALQGKDEVSLANEWLKKAQIISYATIKAAHIKDHQHFFNRVQFQLAGRSSNASLPTDERLKRFAEGAKDPDLELLYFNFGRYLLIASSRTPQVPANLQGIWNHHLQPPWSSNYTININTEMNYWPAESGNLSELHQPLLGFLGNLAKTGAVTAKTFYNAGGWCAAHNTDIWAMSNPVGHFGQGSPSWANWNMGGAWLATHLWEHFDYTRDTVWLKTYGYGLMKGAAQFCLDVLVDDGKGHLVTSPSTSPENIFITPTGYKGATLYGATADLGMIRELFLQTIAAAKTLVQDVDFQQQLEASLSKLYPYQISKKGHLQEWYHDWEDEDPKHRHQSHLFGLYPGNHISMDQTPELAAACKQTLEVKGDETTGWSKGWRTNLWARLHDGNRTYKMYRELMRFVDPNPETRYNGGGGAYPNLMDAHPPFQIDGNFGGTAAVLEMLVQSRSEEITLLPALPDAWATGSVRGVCARGGFVLNLTWSAGKLIKTEISSARGGKTKVVYAGKTQEVVLKKAEKKALVW